MASLRRSDLLDATLVVVVHAAACAAVLGGPFDHVSDDDFARVTIAQRFAYAPALDPTGTSWLPFPFWLLGGAMMVLGRTLTIARVVSVAAASLAIALPWWATRTAGMPRKRAVLATLFMFMTPWSLWLGASTVPESFVASFTAAAAIAGGGWLVVPILLACLSRYDPWPVAALVGVGLAWRRRPLALVALVGPLAWMAWNIHAHGDALHFFHRVASFKRAHDGVRDAATALALYPRLLLVTRPELTLATLLALPSLKSRELRRRWAVPLACVLAQVAFLAYGSLNDGAPAHHSERALLASFFVLAAFAVDGIAFQLESPAMRAAALVALLAAILFGLRGLRAPPGNSPAEDRRAIVARGEALRDEPSLVVTPCAYEHFALIAGYGAPERVTLEPAPPSAAALPESMACPSVRPGAR